MSIEANMSEVHNTEPVSAAMPGQRRSQGMALVNVVAAHGDDGHDAGHGHRGDLRHADHQVLPQLPDIVLRRRFRREYRAHNHAELALQRGAHRRPDVYSGTLPTLGGTDVSTALAAVNYVLRQHDLDSRRLCDGFLAKLL